MYLPLLDVANDDDRAFGAGREKARNGLPEKRRYRPGARRADKNQFVGPHRGDHQLRVDLGHNGAV